MNWCYLRRNSSSFTRSTFAWCNCQRILWHVFCGQEIRNKNPARFAREEDVKAHKRELSIQFCRLKAWSSLSCTKSKETLHLRHWQDCSSFRTFLSTTSPLPLTPETNPTCVAAKVKAQLTMDGMDPPIVFQCQDRVIGWRINTGLRIRLEDKYWPTY